MAIQERRGSVRVMTPERSGVVRMSYTDFWSAFDRGPSQQPVPGIGAARCACAVRSFMLTREAGIQTHFLEQVAPDAILVQEFAVPGLDPLSGQTHGRVLPLEWIWRDRVYGSLWSRIQTKEITPKELGFPEGADVVEGMKLPRTLIECTTKFEEVDRLLSNLEAMSLAELDLGTWMEARYLLNRLVATSTSRFESVGFTCPDGKLELGLDHDGAVVAVDVWGTPDENRILDAAGDIYSKDLIRNWLKSQTEWMTALKAAKEAHPDDKSQWPEYPELPAWLIAQVRNRYQTVAAAYAG